MLPFSRCTYAPTWPLAARPDSSAATAFERGLPARGSVQLLLLEMRRADPALYKHSLEVWALAQQLVLSLGYSGEEQAIVTRAALVHDVGKLTLPRSLLDKPARLAPQEDALMRQHPAVGARLLEQAGVEERIVALVSRHHERWDGQGYPDGLAGLVIPRGARLIAIADAFSAMTAPRPYQAARSVPVALQELERGAGTQFDPQLVPQCVASLWKTR